MTENSAYPNYCAHPNNNGLTCLESDLILVKVTRDSKSENAIIKDTVFQCHVCKCFYKHCCFEKYETRNFDCDEGWWTPLDRYFKVEELYANEPPLSLEEAQSYGFEGADFTWKDGRCNFEESKSGLTCRSTNIKFLAWATPEKQDSYDDQIFKCNRCGQLYKRLWTQKYAFHFYKPPHIYYFPAAEAELFD